ncbi:MAG: hypothetical protein U1E35_08180 [Rhodospirillales bacterium]
MDMLADPKPLVEGASALQTWLAREFSSPSIIGQTATIAGAALLAFLIAPPLQRWIRTWHRRIDTESRIGQSTNAFVRRLTLALLPLLSYGVAALLLGVAMLVAQDQRWPHQAVKLAASLLAAWVVIRPRLQPGARPLPRRRPRHDDLGGYRPLHFSTRWATARGSCAS